MSRLPFSTHPAIHNKPPCWDPSFASGWIQQEGTLQDLCNHVLKGGAFIAAAMTSDHRTSAAFSHADLAAVDIDNGLSIEEFLAHPLAAHAAFVYTTASHDPAAGKHRFRVIFRLPERIKQGDTYKSIVTILTRALGGDKSCTDPTRLFYGCDTATVPLWTPDAVLPSDLIVDAEDVIDKRRTVYDENDTAIDEASILKAIFVLEQVIPPTNDGEREMFIRISAAAKAGGDALFPAWSDWSSRGHHGSGSRSRQSTERFFGGLRGSSLGTLFFLASEADPEWRSKLPEELRNTGEFTRGRNMYYAGYSWEDFMGDPATPPDPEAVYGLFDPDAAWAQVATPTPAAEPVARVPDTRPGYTDADFEGDPVPVPAAGGAATDPPKGKGGRPKKAAGKRDPIDVMMDRLRNLYPGLRLNLATQNLEFGPRDQPCSVPDATTTYIRISRGSGEVFPKTQVTDLMHVIGYEQRYNPVTAYLDNCLAGYAPCPYFDELATTLIGLSKDPLENPKLPSGQLLANAVMRRMLIGAVARALKPGCEMDWVPILVGPQNLGKSAFFRYLTPELPDDSGSWTVTLQQGIAVIKDRPHVMHCGWIVVLDEIERYFKRQYVEELKNLVSVSKDLSAKKYQNEMLFPRSFILVGATNSTDFLQDPTGNRRFMPIMAQGVVASLQDPQIKTIDLDRLKADRESIWAAAYQAYLAGETWQFSSYEISQIEKYMQGFTVDSSIDQRVEQELSRVRTGIYKGRSYVTLNDLFRALQVDIQQQKPLQQPVIDYLKKAGWIKKHISVGGHSVRAWFAPGPTTLISEKDD